MSLFDLSLYKTLLNSIINFINISSEIMPGRIMTRQQQLKLIQICQYFNKRSIKIDWNLTAQQLNQATNSNFNRKQCQLKYLNYLSPKVGLYKTVPQFLQDQIFESYSQGNSPLSILNTLKIRGISQLVLKNFCKKQKQKICRAIGDLFEIQEIKKNYRNFLVLFAKAPILAFYFQHNCSLKQLKQLITLYKHKKQNQKNKMTKRGKQNKKQAQNYEHQSELNLLNHKDQKTQIIQFLHQIMQLYKRADPNLKLKNQLAKYKEIWIQRHILGLNIQLNSFSPTKSRFDTTNEQNRLFQIGNQFYNQQLNINCSEKVRFDFQGTQTQLELAIMEMNIQCSSEQSLDMHFEKNKNDTWDQQYEDDEIQW